ncbi:Chromosome partition protein Smc [archaeon HR01]|nr:Chromosome partition protein Smc [archaeon HR01]
MIEPGLTPQSKTYIREVVLENFMSHEYSRISFSRGLNIIVGPNGSGKSSILLAISVALGQSYTERGQRLSDLIRRGADAARVSVTFDNRPVNGVRPIPSVNSDNITITRFMKKSGDYWHYINNRFKPKAEVEHFLARMGINPDNLLIVMHQNMIEQFVGRDSREKLSMIEEAVGARGLREKILEAETKLSSLSAEEAVLRKTLEEARSAVEFWRSEYQKLTIYRDLVRRRGELEKEYAWSLVNEARRSVSRVEEKIGELEEKMVELEGRVGDEGRNVDRILGEILGRYRESDEAWLRSSLENLVSHAGLLGMYKERMRAYQSRVGELRQELSQLEKELSKRLEEALSKGAEVETSRKPQELAEEIKQTALQIAGLGQVSEDSEDMFLIAESKYREAELRAQQLSDNVRKALEEVEYRKETWKTFIRSLINEVEPVYSQILSLVGGVGRIELRNLDDISKASIEIFVGFRGVEPALLNEHTQSGGERIVATLAFLLALQKYVKSPFRAIDEFDVHLDPLNRERIINILTSTARQDPSIQYIMITPGRVTFTEDMNVIVVQSVQGRSLVAMPVEGRVSADG